MSVRRDRVERRDARHAQLFENQVARKERLEREGKEAYAALEPVLAPLAQKLLDVAGNLPEEQKLPFVQHALATLTLNALDSESDPENFGWLISRRIDTQQPVISGPGRENVGEAIVRDALLHVQRESVTDPTNERRL